MLRYINKKIRNRKGFSLIELIVVVGILGILAMVAIPRVTTSLTTAKTNTDYTNARSIANAINLAIAEGKLTAQDYVEILDEDTTNGTTIHDALLTNGYFDKLPYIQSTSTDSAKEYFEANIEYDETNKIITKITITDDAAANPVVYYPR